MTEDALVYTNLLIYTPVPSPYGVIRMDEAIIPIECHYRRLVSLLKCFEMMLRFFDFKKMFF